MGNDYISSLLSLSWGFLMDPVNTKKMSGALNPGFLFFMIFVLCNCRKCTVLFLEGKIALHGKTMGDIWCGACLGVERKISTSSSFFFSISPPSFALSRNGKM